MSSQRYDKAGRMSKVDSTPQGGLAIPAYLTRTGVFTYTYGDGKKVRELRHPDEVFDAASLATLRGATVVEGHPAMVTPQNYRELTAGHVSDDVRSDGIYVAATVRVQDAGVVGGVKDGRLCELSCGYTADVVKQAGTYDGEEYDAVQRNIRYNHVGIGGQGWGRAGSSVALHLDGQDDVAVCEQSYTSTMADKNDAAPVAAPAPIQVVNVADYERAQGTIKAHEATIADLKAKCDAADAALKAATAPGALDAAVTERQSLVDAARALAGQDFKADGLTAEQIRSAAVAKAHPQVKLDGLSPATVEGMFLAFSSTAVKADASLEALKAATAPAPAPVAKTDSAKPTGLAAARIALNGK